jgi:DNA-directed RNA polymerase specialized sigma subunit
MKWLDWYADMDNDQKELVNQHYHWSRTYLMNELRRLLQLDLLSPDLESRLENVSLHALFKAAKYFDPNKQVKFKSFFHRVWYTTLLRERHLAIRQFQRQLEYQDYIAHISPDKIDNAELEIQNKIIKKIRCEIKKLPDIEQDIIHKAFAQNLSNSQIGREYGVSKDAIWLRRKRIMKKLRRAMGALQCSSHDA